MMNKMTRFLFAAAILATPLALPACTMTTDAAKKPLPSLTQQFATPFYVNAANVVVESRYDPLANSRDVSSTFPTPPDMALRRYAETRLRPAGGEGILKFLIEDASVYREGMPSPNKAARWLDLDDKDRYTAMIRASLIREGVAATAPGAMGLQIKLERTLTIPESTSLAERDRLFQGFVADLLGDMDGAVTDALNNTLKLGAGDVAPSPGPFPVEPVQITPQDVNQ